MRYLIFTFVVVALLVGCGQDTPTAPAPVAEVKIVMTEKTMKSYGAPAILVTVKNTGNQTVYNVSVEVQAIKNGIIIDGSNAYPANLGKIFPGESAVDEAILFELTSHDEYDSVRYDIEYLISN